MPTNNLPEIPEMSADRLTSQLYHLPAIIGRLGLSVANAQSALNADYTENVKELISIVKEIIPKTKPEARAEIESLIKQLAPSRYQFTETTLDFSADLSEAVDVAGSIGLGAGFGAVVINAGISVGFARDYRAAARIKTILSAIPADQSITQSLFERADKLIDSGVTLPARSEVSTAINNNLRDILEMTGGEKVPRLTSELPLSPLQRAVRAAEESEQYRLAAKYFSEKAEAAGHSAEGAAKTAGQTNKKIDQATAADEKSKLVKQTEDQAQAAKDYAATAAKMANEVSNSVKATKAAAAAAEAAKTVADEAEAEQAQKAAEKAATQAAEAEVFLAQANEDRDQAAVAATKAEATAKDAHGKL